MSGQHIDGMVIAPGGDHAIMIDPENGHFGWTFRRHPDGQWVSARKATDVEMRAATDFAKHTGQAMLAAAPVPPAGDVEVLKFNRHPIQWALIDANYCAKQNSPAANAYLLLDAKHDINILYAHVTRLTADNDAIRLQAGGMQMTIDELTVERDGMLAEVERAEATIKRSVTAEDFDALQSELTKVLEDLRLEKLLSAAERQQAEDFKALSWERGQELTKARELLAQVQPCNENYVAVPGAWFLRRDAFLAHQSAPAAKGVSDE